MCVAELILLFQETKKSFVLKHTFYCVAPVPSLRNGLYLHSVTEGLALDLPISEIVLKVLMIQTANSSCLRLVIYIKRNFRPIQSIPFSREDLRTGSQGCYTMVHGQVGQYFTPVFEKMEFQEGAQLSHRNT